MKTIYLIRHGQTLFNAQHKIQGFCDSPLTELGIKQAMVAGEYIKSKNVIFDHAYCSTSERAIDTLKILVDMPFSSHKNLREWNFGKMEGEGEHLNPSLPYGDFFVKFGGESEKDFQKRFTEEVYNLVENSNGKNIMIVAHGAAIAQFANKWESRSSVKRTGRIQNCSFLKYEFITGEFILKEIIEHNFDEIK